MRGGGGEGGSGREGTHLIRRHAPSCRWQRKLALHAGALCGARGHGRVACWMLVDRLRSWQETWKEGAVQVFLVVDSRLASRRSMR